MRLRKQNKWTRRLKKVAAPVAAAGAVAGTMIIAGGKDSCGSGVGARVHEYRKRGWFQLSLHPLVECEGFSVHHRELFHYRNRARSWVRWLQDLLSVKRSFCNP